MPITYEQTLRALRDPDPPVPGPAERAAIGARAGQILRRRRAFQGAGALACVAIVGVGVVALVDSGGASSSNTAKIEAATAPEPGTRAPDPAPDGAGVSAPDSATASEPQDVTDVPAAENGNTAAPAPADTPTPSPDPTVASVSVTASNVPEGVTLSVTLVGAAGTFSTSTTNGVVSFSGVPAGDYELRWDWSSTTGDAAAVGRFPVTLAAGANAFNFP